MQPRKWDLMSRFTKLFAANAFAGAGICSAAIALSPAAAADPVIPPAIPDLPALNMLQQFATNPAGIGAVLQTAATALNGASTMVGAPPAGSTLPISPIDMGPGIAGVAPVAAPVAAPTNPIADFLPLLNQVGIPGSLINLAPANLPFPISPAPVVAPVITPPAGAIAPIASVPPTGGVLNPLPLLSALP